MKLIKSKNENSDQTKFTCQCCGVEYNEMPLCFGSTYPAYYFLIPPKERTERIAIEDSLCVIDEKYFFHRGRLIIPINDFEEDLIFNIWTSISEDNFRARMELWENPDRIKQAPYFGWLQNDIPSYGDTLNKQTLALENEVGIIPSIKMIEENHKLSLDQENGISLAMAKRIVNEILREAHQSD